MKVSFTTRPCPHDISPYDRRRTLSTFDTMRRAALVLPLLVAFASAATLPDYIKPCRRGPKFNQCALANGNEAIPKLIKGDSKLKIPSLDPILVKEIAIQDSSSRSIAMNLTFNDLMIHNLGDARIVKSLIDLDKKHLEWALAVPKVHVETKYKVNGKFLVLPIQGSGKGVVDLENVKLNYILTYKLSSKKGVEYATIVDSDVTFVANPMRIKLDNLFNGDKNLGDNMNAVLNENWKELMTQLGPPIAKSIAVAVKPISEKFVSQVPFDQLFMP